MPNKFILVGGTVIMFLLLTSCAVPKYDEKLDNQITELQQSIDSGLGEIEGYSLFYEQSVKRADLSKAELEKLRVKCDFKYNYKFYNNTEVNISIILIRISVTPSIPQGPVNAINKIQDEFQSVKDSHASHEPCLRSAEFALWRKRLTADFIPLYNYLLQSKVGISDSTKAN